MSLFLVSSSILGQNLYENYPKKFYLDTDSVRIRISRFPDRSDSDFEWWQKLKPGDTVSPGTDGADQIKTYIYINNDTVVIPHKCFPYNQKINIKIETPQGEAILAFRYNGLSASFSQAYMDEARGKASIEHPEVYELANIIWYLSSAASKTGVRGSSKYHHRVDDYFASFRDHQIFKDSIFNKERENYYDDYFDFRENSFAFQFDNNSKIISNNRYFYVIGDNWANESSFFRLLPLVQDFSDKSGFRQFYKENSFLYNEQSSKLDELLPLSNMWEWLENEFPDNFKIDSYKIIYSPLITGSHSTQKYVQVCPPTKGEKDNPLFWEIVMFICDSEFLDQNSSYTKDQKKGLMSGIVFTEIDHNYVNPESDKYSRKIMDIFNKTEIWNSKDQIFYKAPKSVFNEYMTHSLFCLWVLDNFDKESADVIIKERVAMNQQRRGFIKFEKFNNALIELRQKYENKKIAELYPLIIDWCSTLED
ncbi:MAG: DUF4932 domain-containing protein [Dysgonomonas sp.]